MKIHQGDTVIVIAGKDKGKTGAVIRVLPSKNRVVVAGVNMRTKHMRKTQTAAGQRIRFEAAIAVSNVMIVDPKSGKPTRIGYRIDEKTGRKVRIAKRSGAVLERSAKPVAAKKGAEDNAKKADAPAKKKAGAKKKDEAPATDAPKKSPFWKRMGFGSEAMDDAAQQGGKESAPADAKSSQTTTHARSGSRGS